MTNSMKCPKCKENLSVRKSKNGINLGFCSICKGTLISKADFLKAFNDHIFAQQLVRLGLQDSIQRQLLCPMCEKEMHSGHVHETDIELEECNHCQLFFIDHLEFGKIFLKLNESQLSLDKAFKEGAQLFIPTDKNCPICEDKKLQQIGKENFAVTCFDCGGLAMKVETLERLISKSLFAPIMFTEREGRGAFSVCRHCHEEQEKENRQCRKCKKKMISLDCISCSGKMTEYDLDNLFIERCQFCNDLWLDGGELEKVLTVMPDIRRHYERLKRKAELTTAATQGAAYGVMAGIDQSRRDIMMRSGIIYRLLFLSKY
jgi:Zn-finger nucleic acid-binding protein